MSSRNTSKGAFFTEFLESSYICLVEEHIEENKIYVGCAAQVIVAILSAKYERRAETSSRRTHYVAKLMRHISVDSYGACLHNRDLPEGKVSCTDDANYALTYLLEILEHRKLI